MSVLKDSRMADERTDRYFMHRALALARRGLGGTQPNPLVGAVVVKDGNIVGRGYHKRAGEAHAEVIALDQAGAKARGATLYVTLEPCSHFGRTPPCADRVIASGVKRVVIATPDPNPVSGGGITKLRTAGLDLSVGCRQAQAERLALPYLFALKQGRPLVTARAAVTLDGKIGVRGGRIQISGPACENTRMKLRAEAGAILVGISTLLNDDPLLTVRGPFAARKPIRAVVDPDFKTPASSRLINSEGGAVRVYGRADIEGTPEGAGRVAELKNHGATVVALKPNQSGKLDSMEILKDLAGQGVNAVLVEGGAGVYHYMARAGLVDRWRIFLSPTLLGPSVNGQPTVPFWADGGFSLRFQSVIRHGADWEISAVSEKEQ
ncbi:MAG: bifunctional diaminohydroxyphosphoribosylaminopyrimidine deaminase/5-amino-6-(5-phosphoribosylamino)uracil reductase RibD [Pseudomonadota bacterium]